MEELTYLIFNSDLKAYIPTNLKDYKEVEKIVSNMNSMLPTTEGWDYSNANWTLKYRNIGQ